VQPKQGKSDILPTNHMKPLEKTAKA